VVLKSGANFMISNCHKRETVVPPWFRTENFRPFKIPNYIDRRSCHTDPSRPEFLADRCVVRWGRSEAHIMAKVLFAHLGKSSLCGNLERTSIPLHEIWARSGRATLASFDK
jgi:hypothetical protein